MKDIPQNAEQFASLYTKNDVTALLIGWHPSTVSEGARNSNEHVLDLASQFPEAFLGILAALDTNASDLTAVARYAEVLVNNPKVKGFKFHPPDQGFYPNDKRFYDIWEIIQASGKPALFHVGFTVLGANTDGGSGIAHRHRARADFLRLPGGGRAGPRLICLRLRTSVVGWRRLPEGRQ